jgi:hypothetical protein
VRQIPYPRQSVERSIARMGRALYIESVEDAASIAGGYEQLAVALGVSADEVKNWSTGMTIPDCMVFLRLLDLSLNAALPPVSEPGACALHDGMEFSPT